MLALMMHTESLQHPALRWFYALSWTALVALLLLQSSSQPVIGPPAPPGEPPLEREILLTIGHVVAFSALVALWWWALLPGQGFVPALIIALLLGLILGTFTELAQAAVPDRSTSWFDLMVNWFTVAITAWRIHRMRAR